jgi:hypothetical protein
VRNSGLLRPALRASPGWLLLLLSTSLAAKSVETIAQPLKSAPRPVQCRALRRTRLRHDPYLCVPRALGPRLRPHLRPRLRPRLALALALAPALALALSRALYLITRRESISVP